MFIYKISIDSTFFLDDIAKVNNMRDFLPIANESFKLKFKEMKTLEKLPFLLRYASS